MKFPFIDVIKQRIGRGSIGAPKELTWSDIRPTELDWLTRGVMDVAKLPTLPAITYRFCYDIFYNSDLIRTIVRAITFETFRNGLIITPKFVRKCVVCGAEYSTGVSVCEICGSNKLRSPDVQEFMQIQKFIQDVNLNDQSLQEVLTEIDTDLNVLDNAFLAVVKEYYFQDGKMVGAKPLEVLRANPESVALIMDKSGRFGYADDGRLVMFCLEHRDRYELFTREQVEKGEAVCKECKKQMFPAYYVVRKSVPAKMIYYTNGEMLHIKKFSSGIGYGLSPIYTVYQKVLILMKMDYFVLTAYHLERPPKGLLILKGSRESLEKAWRKLQEEAKVNPHMIYPLIVEGAKDVKNVVEWLDLTIRAQDIDFIQYREEIRRTVGALWGVMPMFTGESGGYGLANEGLQILVTNRAVKVEQSLFNEKVLGWLCKTMGFNDWVIELAPNEGRDIVARIQREEMRIRNAIAMQNLGYKPMARMTEDGLDFDYYVTTPEGTEEIPRGVTGMGKRRSLRTAQRFEGEPVHGRPRVEEPRYEGEEVGVRQPKTEAIGTVGELYGDQFGEIRAPSSVEMGAINLEKDDAEQFTQILDEDDYNIVKGWFSKAMDSLRLEETKDMDVYADFWQKYAGIRPEISRDINTIIRNKVRLDREVSVDKIVDAVVKATGIDKEQAKTIVRTELSVIANKARELAYSGRTNVEKFKWVPSSGACPLCQEVARKTRNGVTIEQLKNIIKTVGGASSRELLVHPNCRCSFIRAFHKERSRRWEKLK
ncbi:MAG: hypothetical protein ACUVUF_08540 [Candidatus Bathycorpusculaceae bacterium]